MYRIVFSSSVIVLTTYQIRKVSYHQKHLVIVFNIETHMPSLFSLVYSALRLKSKSVNTQHDAMTSISLWLTYWRIKFGEEFEAHFFTTGLEYALSEIEGFSSFLQLRNKLIQPATLKQRVNALQRFFHFLNNRYTSLRYLNVKPDEVKSMQRRYASQINAVFGDVTGSLNRRRQSNSCNMVPFSEDFRSLDRIQVEKIKEVLRPSTHHRPNPLNPWKSHNVQVRNYLIIILMLEYGLRRGEVLLLTTISFKPLLSGAGYALIVTDHHDQHDNRQNQPSIKTDASHRTLSLSHEDYELLSFYVEECRPTEKHAFLFTSSKTGQALSLVQVNGIVSDVHERLRDLSMLSTGVRLSPHVFRHTWATNMLSYLLDIEKLDMERAKDQLRLMGGWTITSQMPLLYAKRYVSERGNSANLERIRRNDS